MEYMVKFRQIIVVLGWEDGPLVLVYYQDLTDFMKDEITRAGRKRALLDLVTQAIEIDNN
jgi:hypothetical protein